jgi:hypothetical protein
MHNKLSKETAFFIFLLEKYAEHKGITAPEALKIMDSANLTTYIKEMYPMYHIESIENAFMDINEKLFPVAQVTLC